MEYNTADIANRITLLIKKQKLNKKDMLDYCNLGINTISEFSKGKKLSSISLAKIADYLDCSVDYLLGRTDNPEINNEPVITTEEIVERFDELSDKSQNEFIKYLNKLTLEQMQEDNNNINKEAK